jgi:hypothetical protein
VKPRLVKGGLTDRIYVATRYAERENGVIVAQTKYDVTDDFYGVLERLGYMDDLIATGHIRRVEGD